MTQTVLILLAFLAPPAGAVGVPPRNVGCSSSASAHGGSGAIDVGLSDGKCGAAPGAHPVRGPSSIRWVDCGPRGAGETTTASGGPCVQVAAACAGAPPSNPGNPGKTTMVAEVSQRADGSELLMSITCDVPIGNRPAVTGAAIRAQAQKLVPHPRIGVAPPGGATLVNTQTLLWVDTETDRDLGTVTLLGQRVGLRVHVHTVAWTFGDGDRTTATTPGRAYDPSDPCRQAMCPTYGGHVYRSTGAMPVTAQVTWTGEFRVGTGAWRPIGGIVTGPAQTTTITVRQARGVLVPNDTGR
jgi:hypothetical protein